MSAPETPTTPTRASLVQRRASHEARSFYDPELDEGYAFEELICFHGGIGGPQTRPFILHPKHLRVPAVPILGAARVHGILSGWRTLLQADPPQRIAAPA